MTFSSTRSLLDDLLTARHDDALLLAYREADQPPFGDEEMKVKVRRGRVVEMSKTMDPAEADGENLGIVKFGPAGAAAPGRHHGRLVDAGGAPRLGAARVRASSRRTRPLHAIGTRGLPWIEIDFPEDYERAVRDVLPRSMPTRHALRRAWDGDGRRALERRTAAADRYDDRISPTRHETHCRSPAGRADGSRAGRAGGAAAHRRDRRRHRAAERAARTAARCSSRDERAREIAPRDRLVAIVATSDDGGSSGRLRAEFNIIPPGDIRNCLAALSDNQSLHRRHLPVPLRRRRRPERSRDRQPGADGARRRHERLSRAAVEIAARVVGARGIVLPATSELVTLVAEFEDGRVLSGETAIAAAGGRIARLALMPERPRFLPETCDVHRAAPT